jgi:hypothetical protein
MVSAEGVIALCERLKQQSQLVRRGRRGDAASDLRLAVFYLRRFAAVIMIDEAAAEEPGRRRQIEDEATDLWRRARSC